MFSVGIEMELWVTLYAAAKVIINPLQSNVSFLYPREPSESKIIFRVFLLPGNGSKNSIFN